MKISKLHVIRLLICVSISIGNPPSKTMMMKTKRKKTSRSRRKTALLCVPKIVATTPIHVLVDAFTFVQQMALLIEAFVPMDYIGMTKKSKPTPYPIINNQS